MLWNKIGQNIKVVEQHSCVHRGGPIKYINMYKRGWQEKLFLTGQNLEKDPALIGGTLLSMVSKVGKREGGEREGKNS